MLDIQKITVIEDTPVSGVKQVTVDPADLYPAAVARIREILGLLKKEELGNADAWSGLGVMNQMSFALGHGLSAAELPLIAAFFEVPESSFEDALLPVWELPQATLHRSFKACRDKDEQRLFARSYALDCALALFMRSMKVYAQEHGFEYNTKITRDLRYKLAWISAQDAVLDTNE